MKKKISIIMALCFMLLVPNISVRAASNLKISGQTLPSTISVGSYFDCKGKITSDYTLTAVTGAIYSVDLKTTYCTKTVNPNAKSYSLFIKRGIYLYEKNQTNVSYFFNIYAAIL